MHFKGTGNKVSYSMGDGEISTVLEESQLERDLGVWVDSDLKFSSHVAKVVSKANQLLGMMKRAFVYKDGPTVKLLFVALIRPHLEYANAVWHPCLK
jgi:ribonucleases P/MRP protein subunit RPP40